MSEPIYIIGHRNPDADAICSALAYADFKKQIGEPDYVAARCGNTNARIDAILDHFGVSAPVFLGDVTPRVRDIMIRDIVTIGSNGVCGEAMEKMDEKDIRVLPVISDEGTLEGMLSIFQLGEKFIPKMNHPLETRHVHASISDISHVLKGKFLNTIDPDKLEDLYIRVAAMQTESFARSLKEKKSIPTESSIVVVGDREQTQLASIDAGIRLLVISNNLPVSDKVLEKAKEAGVSVLVSPYDTSTSAWMIRAANRISPSISKEVHTFQPEEKVSQVRRRLAGVSGTLFAVVDEGNRLEGIFTKTNLLNPSQTRLVLVDHNELGQAVPGAHEVEILEIVDHHRLGNPPTDQPILFINRPVGSTCTIVADLFRQRKMTPSKAIAGIMMGGIISDTINLRGPTTTNTDREILEWLSPIAEISGDDLAHKIFNAGSLILSAPASEVVTADCKQYHQGDIKYSVSQFEELGFDNFWDHAEALEKALHEYRKKESLNFAGLLITDINSQNSLFLVCGDLELVHAINYPSVEKDRIFELKGVVSRKKQLIPYLSSLFKKEQSLS